MRHDLGWVLARRERERLLTKDKALCWAPAYMYWFPLRNECGVYFMYGLYA